MNAQTVMNQYKTVGLKSGVDSASPHQLIDMLLKGAMGKISEAKAAMAGGQIALKGEAVGKAIAIVEYLRVSLDPGIDAAFSEQLGELYRYIETRLLEANLKNDAEALDEAQALLRELSAGWAGIPAEYRTE